MLTVPLGVQFSLSGTVLHAYYFGISKIRNGMERMDGTNRTVDLCICDQSTTYLLPDASWAVLYVEVSSKDSIIPVVLTVHAAQYLKVSLAYCR